MADHNSSPIPDAVDPRINCASGVCCPPGGALSAATAILIDAGCPEEYAGQVAKRLRGMGVAFTSTKLADALAEIADHPDKKT